MHYHVRNKINLLQIVKAVVSQVAGTCGLGCAFDGKAFFFCCSSQTSFTSFVAYLQENKTGGSGLMRSRSYRLFQRHWNKDHLRTQKYASYAYCGVKQPPRAVCPTCTVPSRTATHTRAPSHSRAFCDSINMKALGASTFYPEIFKYLQRLIRQSAIPIIANIHERQAASYHLQMHAQQLPATCTKDQFELFDYPLKEIRSMIWSFAI